MATEESTNMSPDQLLEEGKKQLAAGNAAQAVESFQEACGVLAEKHGQLACELAEPYFLYGKALLELARSQTTVLGSAIPVPNERDDSSDDEGTLANGDAPGSSGNKDAPGASTANEKGDAPGSSTANNDAPGSSTANEKGDTPGSSSANKDAPGSSTANEKGDAPGCSTANKDAPGSSTANEDAPGTSTTNEDAPGESTANDSQEEDESDMKLAWEVLELARVICQKQSSNEYKLKLADVQLVLAEVSMESDQTEQAIADLLNSLQIRELILEPHDRRFAEVHFALGLAYVLSKQPDQAIKHFNSAKNVLVKKKELLDKDLGQADLTEDKKKLMQDEVADINSLIPDVDSKISDTQEMKKLMEERENQSQDQENGFPAQQSTDDKKPVSDITHLIRKRVTEGEESSTAKKPRTEGSNGSTTVTPAEQ